MVRYEDFKLGATYYHNGLPVSWTSFGSGPPLIFIHGTPWSSQLWLPIAQCFAQDYTVYLYDLPGYGQSLSSEVKDGDLTYPEQTETFCALLDHWSEQNRGEEFKPHVIAHDIGGHIALRAHLSQKRSFVSLALVDCGASHPVDEPFFSLVRENTSVFTSLPSELHEALLRRYIRGASYKGLRDDQEDMLVRPWLSKDGQRAFYSQITAQKNGDIEELRQLYRKLDVPLRIVWAKEDTWVPVERAEMLRKAVGGTLKVIEASGHLVQLDAPEQLTFELAGWLQEVGSR